MSALPPLTLDNLLIWHMLRGSARAGYACLDCGTQGEIDRELWQALAKVHGRRSPVKDLGSSLGCDVCTGRKGIQGRIVLRLIDAERLPF